MLPMGAPVLEGKVVIQKKPTWTVPHRLRHVLRVNNLPGRGATGLNRLQKKKNETLACFSWRWLEART